MNDDRMIVGELERVLAEPPGFVTTARVDTGAQSSSLHAENITEFQRDGDDWVRFDVVNEDSTVTIERPVEKYVRVFQQSDKDGTRRAMVKMRILIGNVRDTFVFTLANRSHLGHNMILELNARPGLSIQIANNSGLLPRLNHLQAKDTRKMAINERVQYAKQTLAGI